VARGGNTGQRRGKFYLLCNKINFYTLASTILQDGIATHMQGAGKQKLLKINNLNKLTTLLWHKVEEKAFRFCGKGGQN
jgi:hypothetical protein